MAADVVVLAGGTGGAKLVRGFSNVVGPEHLSAIVNTGDDFEHLGSAQAVGFPERECLGKHLRGRCDHDPSLP